MRSFIKISGKVFDLQSGHEYMVENGYVQCSKGNNSKSRKNRVVCYVLICVKFRENTSNGFQLTERT